MKLIAHRGLFNGPNKELENNPDQIEKAWNLGFDCEIDLLIIKKQLFLGHDNPQYKINHSFLEQGPLWIHAKNLEALHYLTSTTLNFFWHQEDDYTLTSKGIIWAFPNKLVTNNTVMLMPEWNDPTFNNLNLDCYGICSDWVLKIQNILK